jgi:hypothetical protein
MPTWETPIVRRDDLTLDAENVGGGAGEAGGFDNPMEAFAGDMKGTKETERESRRKT